MDVKYEGVCKSFGSTEALAPLDLTVPDGKFLAMLGPSGCGKTTALRLLAGLEQPTDGRIFIGEREVTKLEPRHRDVAMVFQSYALYPHKTVAGNIAYPLRLRRAAAAERDERVRTVAELLGISELLDRTPRQLSGGQRQRVALARAIIRRPQAFLMDEPLSNLDAQLRLQMRVEIKRLQRELGATTLYVTHDQIEAMTMADLIAVMRAGKLQQLATPAELYERPANLFVARFCGSPPMNTLDGEIADGAFTHAAGRLPLERALDQRPGEARLPAGARRVRGAGNAGQSGGRHLRRRTVGQRDARHGRVGGRSPQHPGGRRLSPCGGRAHCGAAAPGTSPSLRAGVRRSAGDVH